MSGYEAEKAKVPVGKPTASSTDRGQTAEVLTVSGTFTQGADASLDMSGINDMGNDPEVDIYAATSPTPNGRRTGTDDRRAHYAPAPASFPTDLAGGTWVASGNFWVQVVDTANGLTSTWQGHIAATAGTHDIQLTKQPF